MIADPNTRIDNFERTYRHLARLLVGTGKRVGDKPHQMQDAGNEWTPVELTNVVFEYSIPMTRQALAIDVRPSRERWTPGSDYIWAEEHFQERVSGIPHNPPPSYERWPYTQRGHEDHLKGGKFSHTYPERMWPRDAWIKENGEYAYGPYAGIRFNAGDLNDLINLLAKNPYTRQAYLPIWHPEDLTAARQGERVPCTLGYHFLMRDGKLNLFYPIRSCDLVRFFRDDVYMACRLVQWVLQQLRGNQGTHCVFNENDALPLPNVWRWANPGTLTMHIVSLHCFEGDLPLLRKNYG